MAKPVEVRRDPTGQSAPVSQRFSRYQGHSLPDEDRSSRKRKRGPYDDGEDGGKLLGDSTQGSRNMGTDPESLREAENNAPVERTEEHVPGNPPKSDTDWLRGKTTRLLDLVEDDTAPILPSLYEATSEDATNGQTGKEAADAEDLNHSETWKKLSIPNARLFIRNLPFDTREEELRGAFSRHGRISEVGALFH